MFSLNGHTAIVTGGASGIGLATAGMLAEIGANVVIADLNEEMGVQVAERLKTLGAGALFVRTDVADAGDARAGRRCDGPVRIAGDSDAFRRDWR